MTTQVPGTLTLVTLSSVGLSLVLAHSDLTRVMALEWGLRAKDLVSGEWGEGYFRLKECYKQRQEGWNYKTCCVSRASEVFYAMFVSLDCFISRSKMGKGTQCVSSWRVWLICWASCLGNRGSSCIDINTLGNRKRSSQAEPWTSDCSFLGFWGVDTGYSGVGAFSGDIWAQGLHWSWRRPHGCERHHKWGWFLPEFYVPPAPT